VAAGPDAKVVLTPGQLFGLLQLPDGWLTGQARMTDSGFIEVDVVFPDGPSEHEPIMLVPHYRRVHHADGKAILLDHVSVQASTPDRPRRRWLSR